MSNFFDRMLEESQSLQSSDSPALQEQIDTPNTPSLDESTYLTSSEVKAVVQELLKHGFLEESKRADLFRRGIALQAEVARVLEPLDLIMKIDSYRGIAYLATTATNIASTSDDEEGAWSHPLVRRQRLTLEQSLLIAMLRQAFVLHEQETGVGSRDATISIDELLPQYLVYFEDSGSDSKNESRLLSLLDQLKTYGIVSEVDKKQEVTIRPLIAHLANPESLTALLRVMEQRSNDNTEPSTVSGDA
jgi:hypothetical protein